MSAPAGWYPQPDGRQRYWDGAQWTEHFHGEATPEVPSAGEASTPSATEVPAGAQAYGQGHGQPSAGETTYGQPAYGQPAYGQPGQAGAYGTPPASTGKSGLGKGCLIAGIIGLVILALIAVLGVMLFNKAKDEVDKITTATSSAAPSSDPGLPSLEPASPSPDESSSPLVLSAAIGKGFALDTVTVADGWTVTKMDFLDMYTIDGMTAVTPPTEEYVLFDLEFMNGEEVIDTSMCSAEAGKTEISCLPLTKDISAATEVRAKNSF